MRAGLQGKGFLDPETCWKSWHKIGSLGGVQNQLLKEGKVNPKTGNPATKSGIEKAAFSWAIENQEQARKDMTFAWQEQGFILDDEEWEKFLFKMARLVFYQRPRRFEKFVSENRLEHLV